MADERRRYFIAERREAYLDGLRRTGNHAAAAREVGITAGGARRYRRRKPEFEALCAEAESEARRRLAGAEGADERGADPAFESIRRGADGKLKIQAKGRRRWSRKAEDRFFAVLRECGNIAASARAARVSREAVWKRRRAWPAFARRFEEAMEEAEIALEFRVLGLGTNWSEEAEGAESEEALPPRYARSPSSENPGEDCQAPFDAELAIRFLKWREEKRRGRRGSTAALPSVEEVRARILRKVAAIKRYREREAARREEE